MQGQLEKVRYMLKWIASYPAKVLRIREACEPPPRARLAGLQMAVLGQMELLWQKLKRPNMNLACDSAILLLDIGVTYSSNMKTKDYTGPCAQGCDIIHYSWQWEKNNNPDFLCWWMFHINLLNRYHAPKQQSAILQ